MAERYPRPMNPYEQEEWNKVYMAYQRTLQGPIHGTVNHIGNAYVPTFTYEAIRPMAAFAQPPNLGYFPQQPIASQSSFATQGYGFDRDFGGRGSDFALQDNDFALDFGELDDEFLTDTFSFGAYDFSDSDAVGADNFNTGSDFTALSTLQPIAAGPGQAPQPVTSIAAPARPRGFGQKRLLKNRMLNLNAPQRDQRMITATENRTTCPILRLPQEIRDKIWERVYAGIHVYIHSRGQGAPVRAVTFNGVNYPVVRLVRGQKTPVPAAERFPLLSPVCRHFYNETALLPFRLCAFHFEDKQLFHAFTGVVKLEGFEQALNISQRRVLAHIVLPADFYKVWAARRNWRDLEGIKSVRMSGFYELRATGASRCSKRSVERCLESVREAFPEAVVRMVEE